MSGPRNICKSAPASGGHKLARIFRKPRKGMFILSPMREQRRIDDLCGGRRLVGAEFLARKKELEARDKLERRQTA